MNPLREWRQNYRRTGFPVPTTGKQRTFVRPALAWPGHESRALPGAARGLSDLWSRQTCECLLCGRREAALSVAQPFRAADHRVVQISSSLRCGRRPYRKHGPRGSPLANPALEGLGYGNKRRQAAASGAAIAYLLSRRPDRAVPGKSPQRALTDCVHLDDFRGPASSCCSRQKQRLKFAIGGRCFASREGLSSLSRQNAPVRRFFVAKVALGV